MVPFILATLVALFPPVHVLRCECISTTVTKTAIVHSTFEVIGAPGRFKPFEVEYLRPTRSSRGAPDLLTHPPFQPGEEAFWIVLDHGKGKLEAIVSPSKAKKYLPELRHLTRSLNPETVRNGVTTQESQELNYVSRLAALVSATVEPQLRDRLPEILVRYRESEEPILREFVRWYDSRPLKGPVLTRQGK